MKITGIDKKERKHKAEEEFLNLRAYFEEPEKDKQKRGIYLQLIISGGDPSEEGM